MPARPGAVPRAVKLPPQWELIREPAGVRLERGFGWTAALAPHERVWLVLEGLRAACRVSLNGASPAEVVGDVQFDITRALRGRNTLCLECAGPPAGPLWDEIAVEVRGQAWLAGLSVRRAGERLVASGRVEGRAEGRLDLYGVLDRRTILQAAVEAGSAFEVMTDELAPIPPGAGLRVELMHGSTVLHAAEVPVLGGQV